MESIWKWIGNDSFLFLCLVDPWDGNPLMLVGKNFQCFDHFAEGLVGIFVYNNLIKIFLVNSLYTSTLLQGIFKIFFLWSILTYFNEFVSTGSRSRGKKLVEKKKTSYKDVRDSRVRALLELKRMELERSNWWNRKGNNGLNYKCN